MQLVSFSHDDFSSLILRNIKLQCQTLIVGKNASGKSRMLSTIEHFTGLLSDNRRQFWWGKWQANFLLPSGDSLDYTITMGEGPIGSSERKITEELLKLNDQYLIERRDQNGENFYRVFSESTGLREDFAPPLNQLVLHTHRDLKAHPSFEKLIEWGDNTYSFLFGNIRPQYYFDGGPAISTYRFWGSVYNESSEESQKIVDIYVALPLERQSEILQLMQEMGFQLSLIQVANANSNEIHGKDLAFRELGVERPLLSFQLSQGMLRLVSLLIFFSYLVHVKKTQLLLIDDLGEGLDYSRSYKLGKFIFDTCKEVGVQLIATSNDSFLMNAIPIDYWNVLRRNGSDITAINKENSPQLFDDFECSGLSNFDFLSSDFIESHQE